MLINAPNLKTIAQDLNVMGSMEFVDEFPFPYLETIGGEMNIAYTGLQTFPKSIKKVV